MDLIHITNYTLLDISIGVLADADDATRSNKVQYKHMFIYSFMFGWEACPSLPPRTKSRDSEAVRRQCYLLHHPKYGDVNQLIRLGSNGAGNNPISLQFPTAIRFRTLTDWCCVCNNALLLIPYEQNSECSVYL